VGYLTKAWNIVYILMHCTKFISDKSNFITTFRCDLLRNQHGFILVHPLAVNSWLIAISQTMGRGSRYTFVPIASKWYLVVLLLLTYLFLIFRHKPLKELLHTNCLVYTLTLPFSVPSTLTTSLKSKHKTVFSKNNLKDPVCLTLTYFISV